jgi:hypothetical protein
MMGNKDGDPRFKRGLTRLVRGSSSLNLDVQMILDQMIDHP